MKIIFVYNANSGLFNQLSDFAHKIFSPKTYDCQLCMITYGNLGMKKQWKSFIESLNYEVEFLHKDEFENKEFDLPAVFVQHHNGIKELITSKEMNEQKDLNSLIRLMDEKLKLVS